MPTAEAEVLTERASRYLVQLCRHASQLGRNRPPAHITQARHEMPRDVSAGWSDTHGTVSAAGGTCTLRATPDALILRIDADNDDTLHRMQDLITSNLTRFSRRDPLTVNWSQPEEPAVASGEGHAPVPTGHATTPRRRKTIVLIVVAALAVTAHVVLGGAILAAPQWTTLAADVILAVVLLKIALIGLGYLAHRRRKATRSR